mmetsp:Transcript_101379/g.316033  ORF Transcript_101379/g.316033 Transcript_101379/m.316033 type:complete len:258 (-) Transcript_101379:321-1094(-)
MVAGTLDSATEDASSHRSWALISRRSGAAPSAAADQASISAAEGSDAQARSAQGSRPPSSRPRARSFCCSTAFAARRTLLTAASARPSPVKRTSPREHTAHPTTTKHVGRSNQGSKGMPSRSRTGMDIIGWTAARISAKATELSSRTLFPRPMQVAKHMAMGRISNRKSLLVGIGTACPPFRRRPSSTPNAARAAATKCTADTARGKLKPHSTKTAFTDSLTEVSASKYATMLQISPALRDQWSDTTTATVRRTQAA